MVSFAIAQMLYRSNGRYNAMGHHLGCTIETALSMNIIKELPAVVGRILKMLNTSPVLNLKAVFFAPSLILFNKDSPQLNKHCKRKLTAPEFFRDSRLDC